MDTLADILDLVEEVVRWAATAVVMASCLKVLF